MGLLRKLAEIRENQILENAEPFLDEGEKVLTWVRTTRPNKRARGFMFVTDQRVLLAWSKGSDETQSITWDEIEAWGVAADGGEGPLLAIETAEQLVRAHILVRTDGMVAKANEFLVNFVAHAAAPKRELMRVDDALSYQSSELHVRRERKTVGKHTRRAIVTIIGLCLIVIAFLIGWIPGPWSIPLVIAGLAVLATEYDWADDFLTWSKQRYEGAKAKFRARRSPTQ